MVEIIYPVQADVRRRPCHFSQPAKHRWRLQQLTSISFEKSLLVVSEYIFVFSNLSYKIPWSYEILYETEMDHGLISLISKGREGEQQTRYGTAWPFFFPHFLIYHMWTSWTTDTIWYGVAIFFFASTRCGLLTKFVKRDFCVLSCYWFFWMSALRRDFHVQAPGYQFILWIFLRNKK
jgi:hypothetical protein